MHKTDWNRFQFMAFDSPLPSLLQEEYFKRYFFLNKEIEKGNNLFVQLVRYEDCSSKDNAESIFFRIRAQGGEGIILRDPTAPYVHGYTRSLYKYKGFNDAEAVVLEKRSESRYLCRVYKLHLLHNANKSVRREAQQESEEIEREIEESEGDGEKEREGETKGYYDIEMGVEEGLQGESGGLGGGEGIEKGQFVSFKYVGEYDGTCPPMNPKIYAIRNDIQNWKQLLSSKQKPPDHQRIWKSEVRSEEFDWGDPKTHLSFFTKFANSNNFDPLNPENWYTVERKHVLPQGKGLLAVFNDSLVRALKHTFPNIGLEDHKFSRAPRNCWASRENRKKFFDEFAKDNHFDTNIPENWYSISKDEILNTKSGISVLQHYKGSLSEALLDVYPLVQFDKNKLQRPTMNWELVETQKVFFDEFAASKKFDPAIQRNWASVSKMDIVGKGGYAILKCYKGSLTKAINVVYKFNK
eukprot:Phypoly_transcript_03474.p1 GENE.Phypoly_transcript_03474~~Phypoly_transcript_03474.p1  ORF type:complete len:467 (+),score=96.35 Phypoly_transcript_03474:1038-2438(+)